MQPVLTYVVTVVFAAMALPALAVDPGRQAVVHEDMHGIVNYSQFGGSPGFAGSPVGFGGATQPSAMPRLKAAGYQTVINLRLAVEDGSPVDVEGARSAAEAVGLNYVHLPFDAKSDKPGVPAEFLALASDPGSWPIYVHCNSATRVAGLWIIGRVLVDGLPFDAAAAEADLIAAKPEKSISFAKAYLQSKPQSRPPAGAQCWHARGATITDPGPPG